MQILRLHAVHAESDTEWGPVIGVLSVQGILLMLNFENL